MAREAPDRIRDLLAYGVPFDRDLEGRLTVGREAAHSARRIVHVRGDQAGRAIMAALVAAVRKTPCIRVLAGLCGRGSDRPKAAASPASARAPSRWQALINMPARAVVLATGGIGASLCRHHQSGRGARPGLAIAARAGAVIADPEFVQFHPTAIDIGRDPAPLATEAIRGEGATLVNNAGERFMLRVHPEAELAPRDIVARARICRTRRPGAARSSMRARPSASLRAALSRRDASLPPRRHRSGARSDPGRAGRALSHGRRRDRRERPHVARRLWAAGEVASTGAHGANRLASNSLLEAVVYAARIADDIGGRRTTALARSSSTPMPRGAGSAADPAREQELRALMSAHVGVIRDANGLRYALARSPAWSARRARRNCATWRSPPCWSPPPR